jgi:hypothetical protein
MNFVGEYQDYKFFSGPLNWIAPRLGGLLLDGGSEDCLFLDVHVPGMLMRNPHSKKVPVVDWIYGGAVSFIPQEYFTTTNIFITVL